MDGWLKKRRRKKKEIGKSGKKLRMHAFLGDLSAIFALVLPNEVVSLPALCAEKRPAWF